jgi:hypothetical protein
MRNYRCWLAPSLVLALALAACSSGPQPQEAVEAFYQHLSSGAIDQAKTLYSAEVQKSLADLPADEFADWVDRETKQGSVERIQVINIQSTEDQSKIEYDIVYRDGSTKRSNVELILEGGTWRLGWVG